MMPWTGILVMKTLSVSKKRQAKQLANGRCFAKTLSAFHYENIGPELFKNPFDCIDYLIDEITNSSIVAALEEGRSRSFYTQKNLSNRKSNCIGSSQNLLSYAPKQYLLQIRFFFLGILLSLKTNNLLL